MPQPDAEAQLRKSIFQNVAMVRELDLNTLYRVADLGTTLGFEVGRATFTRVFFLLRQINEQNLERLTLDGLQALEQFVSTVQQTIGQIRDFRVSTGSNPMNERNNLIDRLDVAYRELFQNRPMLAVLAFTTAERESELRKSVRDALDQLSQTQQEQTQKWAALELEHKSKLESQAKEADSIIQKIREASGSLALQKYSQFFETEATEAKNAAMGWARLTTVIAAVVVAYLVFIVVVWSKSPPTYTPTQAIQLAGAKIALFSVLFYSVTWAGRNFKAQWHVYIVNRHRANTLNSLEAFANSASNEQTREAILMHASSAIFAQVNTGFIPDQADAANSSSILEIVRGAKEH